MSAGYILPHYATQVSRRETKITKQNFKKLTLSLANVVNMPSVKTPNRGPPTAPKIVRAAWSTPPRYSAMKARARNTRPYPQAASFVSQGA